MPNRNDMKPGQQERSPSSRRSRSPLAAAKLLILAALGAVLVIAVVIYLTRGKPEAPPTSNTPERLTDAAVSQIGPGDIIEKSTDAHEPVISDVNEQIDRLKKRKLELAQKLHKDFPDKSEPLILLGNVYRDLGDTSEAVRCWKQALEIGSERPDLYEGMGMVAMEKGEYEDAVRFWRRCLELNPRAPGLRTSIAQALMRLGRFDEAMTELKRQIEMYPASPTAHFLSGQVFLQKKEYEQAREEYLKVISLDPENTNAYYGLVTVSARLGEKEKLEEYREKFNELKAGDTQELIDDNKQISDLASTLKSYSETALDAAKFSEQYGRMTEAGALLDEATEAAANDLDMLTRIAQWHHVRGRIRNALSIHERIAERYPDNGLNLFKLGMLYAQLQRFDEAQNSLTSCTERTPDLPDAYRELARLLLHTKKDIPRAKELAEKAVSLAPTAPNYVVLSRACDTNGDRKAALEALRAAMMLDPANTEYRRIYEILSKPEQ